MYDAYVAFEVAPFVRDHCRTPDIAITTTGSSFGAYHAANTLLKHPDLFRRCLALSGVYDIRRFMDGDYDDNFYFNNPVDYMANLTDGYLLHHLAQADIRLATGNGPCEDSGPTYGASPRCCGRAASRTRSTTGAATAATTGRTGSARWTCTSAGCSRAQRKSLTLC